jgi:hypothetical protein
MTTLEKVIEAANNALNVAKELAAGGKDVGPIVASVAEILSRGKDATQEDIEQLQAVSDEWSSELQKPLPAENA